VHGIRCTRRATFNIARLHESPRESTGLGAHAGLPSTSRDCTRVHESPRD
ncbi:Hypothetical protein EMIHUDRAFT_460886, partial [Emiliania huxleyi CCMP1516]|uniref:Uncharacterized protein n=2 Tax=Emiliania huxleyi TaxID=2903 RepID=A0A0D3HZ55_EMIH1